MSKDKLVVVIGKTVDEHRDIVSEILPAHALSGCDTVACCFGIGNGTVINAEAVLTTTNNRVVCRKCKACAPSGISLAISQDVKSTTA